jgi:type II secretory pathway component PulF
MQAYSYTALSESGEHTQGTLVAANRRDAIERLQLRGWHVLDVREGQEPGAAPGLFRLFRRRGIRLAELTRQLATLQRSGVPLARSLTVIVEQTDDERTAGIFSDVLDAVKTGNSLSDAMARHRDVFPEIMVSMVHTGEVSGTLDEVLERLAELFEKRDAIRSEVRAAMAYPALVLCLGLASAFALVTFVIPRLTVMFEAIGGELPLPTRILMRVSQLVRGRWWAILAGGALLCGAWAALAGSAAFRTWWDRMKLRIPWISTLIRNASMARFSRALGTLVHAEVPIVEALNVARAAAGNRAIEAAISRMAQEVQTGDSLAELMAEAEVFSPLTIQMVAVGEETGRLDAMLINVADAYDRQAAAAARMLTSLLAPVLILCVAVVVGFLILALVLPIFQLSAGIG